MSTNEIIGLDPRTGRAFRVTAADGLIARIDESTEDAALCVSSGFVDLQVNGYAGFDLNATDISIQTVIGLATAMLAQGVTCFAPTLISAPEDQLCHALSVIAEARRTNPLVASCIPLVHMEGPAISPLDGYRGAHPADAVRPPSLAEFDRWQRAADGLVGIVTLSPHFDESPAYISALVQRGVHVAIGHTHASPEQITAAVDAGASLSTHLGNGIALELPRHRNPIWRQLADDRLTASFIADGHHLPADVLKVMLAAKGVSRSILVSDAVALGGMPAGTYSTPVGGQVDVWLDGSLRVSGSTMLAGSAASLPHCIAQTVRMTGLPLADALAMATVNPGRFVAGRGQMVPGGRADLVRFRWHDGAITVHDVWLAGQPIITNQRFLIEGD